MRYSLRSMLVSIGLLSLLLFIGEFLFDSVCGPVVPHGLLGQLNTGMSEAEVKSLLGEPAKQYDHKWIYERWGNPGWLEIEFDESGEYLSYNDESAFPGFP